MKTVELPFCPEWLYSFRILGYSFRILGLITLLPLTPILSENIFSGILPTLCYVLKWRREKKKQTKPHWGRWFLCNSAFCYTLCKALCSPWPEKRPWTEQYSILCGVVSLVKKRGFCPVKIVSILKCLEIIDLIYDQWLKLCLYKQCSDFSMSIKA